eukprot:7390906-Prymnesium_polylepis.1
MPPPAPPSSPSPPSPPPLPPPQPPSPPMSPPQTPPPPFQITTSNSQNCVIIFENPSEICVRSSGYNTTSGYGNGQRCEIRNAPPLPIIVSSFDVQFSPSCAYDYLIIDGNKYCGTTGPDWVVSTSGVIEWFTDSQGTAAGWEVCWPYTPMPPPPLSPPVPPTPPPSPEAPPSQPPSSPPPLCPPPTSPSPQSPPAPPSSPPSPPSPPSAPICDPKIHVTGGSFPVEVRWTLTCSFVDAAFANSATTTQNSGMGRRLTAVDPRPRRRASHGGCIDTDFNCQSWAIGGECARNP